MIRCWASFEDSTWYWDDWAAPWLLRWSRQCERRLVGTTSRVAGCGSSLGAGEEIVRAGGEEGGRGEGMNCPVDGKLDTVLAGSWKIRSKHD